MMLGMKTRMLELPDCENSLTVYSLTLTPWSTTVINFCL